MKKKLLFLIPVMGIVVIGAISCSPAPVSTNGTDSSSSILDGKSLGKPNVFPVMAWIGLKARAWMQQPGNLR